MNRQRRSEAFTLVELLVVISIIALLLAILMPALNKVRSQARTVVCANNERQIGLVLAAYITQYNGCLPPKLGYPWWSSGEQANWGYGISWQHCLVNPSNPRNAVLQKKGDRSLIGLRCPYWPKDFGGFAEDYATTGGYAMNDAFDNIQAWQFVPGANPNNLRQMYIAAKMANVRKPGSKLYVLEITADDKNNNGKLDRDGQDWSKDTVDTWGWLDTVAGGRGVTLYKYHGWLRIDHGQYRLSGPFAMKNLKVLPKDQILNQKLNTLFVDGHVETVTLKRISTDDKMWWPYDKQPYVIY